MFASLNSYCPLNENYYFSAGQPPPPYFSKPACSDYHRRPPRISRCVAPESQNETHTHCPLHFEYVTSPG